MSCSLFRTSLISKDDMFYNDFINELKKRKESNNINKLGFFHSTYYQRDSFVNISSPFSHPKIFFPNGLIYNFRNSANVDSSYYIDQIISRNLDGEFWGVYKVDGNTIKAIVPTNYYKRGYVGKYCLSYFEGILIGTDSISNWRMVPPFPTNIDYELNKDVIRSHQQPKSYSFYPNEIVLKIDTVGAWFNKFIK